MRFRTLALAAALSTGIFHTSDAFVRPRGGDAPTVFGGDGARMHRDTRFVRAVPQLSGWQALWDHDTDVPLRMWGPGISAPNAIADAAAAEAVARAFLSAHLATLAPGAVLTDFTVIANVVSNGVRSIGFEQRSGGLRVVGGAIGFGFKNDRLFVVSSTALPNIAVTAPTARLGTATLAGAAQRWLGKAGYTVRASVSSLLGQPAEQVIIPIVRPRIDPPAPRAPNVAASGATVASGPVDVRYRVAEQLPIEELAGPGQWDVWLDAADGAPIARQSKLSFASGKVLFDVPDQSPTGTRSPQPAPFVTHDVNGVPTTADVDGAITWAGSSAATVLPGLAGPLVAIKNQGGGGLTMDSLTLPASGTVTWNMAANPLADAQLDSYVFANIAKAYAKQHLDPTLPWFTQLLTVNVNLQQTCNAFYDPQQTTLNFFIADAQCENTGRVRDVVYHEFGHSVHDHAIIPGVGQFDGSLSEGLADTLAVSITGDHGLGRGFFFNDMALRDLDPVGLEKRWPQDADGEVHDEGEIIGEALWDLRKGLIAKLGEQAGVAKLLQIYYGVMQRSSDIPSTYIEALVTDDDDGDLTNGTPNLCAINAAFGLHGLADPAFTLGFTTPVLDGKAVKFTVAAATPSSACADATTITSANLAYHIDGAPQDTTVAFAASGTTWSSQLPSAGDGSIIQYKVTITQSNGAVLTYPDNAADPYYQSYVGPTTKLWCSDFESGAAEWTHAGSKDSWQVGAPKGLGGDPKTAHGGAAVFGTNLSSTGSYKPNGIAYADSPIIDLMGHVAVHLQYYRWLTVEDGAFDQASISANGTPLWANHASPMSAMTGINHVDKEWRFQDVDLSAQTASGKVQLRFQIASDQGLELGGWNLDDVCVVAVSDKLGPMCGNGIVEPGEACDDGNTADNDGCSATCGIEVLGEPPMTDGGGCCSTGTSPGGALALGGGVLAMMLRREKARPRRATRGAARA